MARWHATCKVCYVETNEVTKKGKPVLAPIFHRHLFVNNPKPLFDSDSGEYRIVQRGGMKTPAKYTVSIIPQVKQSIWTNPNGQIAAWFKKAPDWLEQDEEGNVIVCRPWKRTDDKVTDEDGIIRWLSQHGLTQQEAKIAIETLKTMEPENQKIAA